MAETRTDSVIHSISNCISSLLSAPLSLQYLAEGAANVIYRVQSTDPSLAEHNSCCVMRMRKELAFTKPCIEVLSAFKMRIVPLFSPDHLAFLMEQALYRLTPEMVEDANTALKRMETQGLRPKSRWGAYHPNFELEMHGILMPNMNRQGESLLLEFKPKWLVQSPTAPKDARRCRTCALNASRRVEGRTQGRGDSGLCPMDLLSPRQEILESTLQNLFSGAEDQQLSAFTVAFKQKIQPALVHLQSLQMQYGSVGLSDFRDPEGKEFDVAMALRDCSMFLEVLVQPSSADPTTRASILDAKFADLDLKTTDGGKLEKWTAMEEGLLSSGAYVKWFPPPDMCALDPSRHP